MAKTTFRATFALLLVAVVLATGCVPASQVKVVEVTTAPEVRVVEVTATSSPTGLEIGMPMEEIELMRDAGKTPMQIIVAATRDAAYVCRRQDVLGTLEVGKFADVLVVDGDPLEDLQSLTNVRLVVHEGVIIRAEGAEE